MRLTGLDISGFRAFTQEIHFDLAADAVIIVGSNGQGKTSFFDAILWALTGSVPRLKKNDEALRSLYSNTGEMRVSVQMGNSDGQRYEIVRSSDGSRQTLRFKMNGLSDEQVFTHDAARLKIIEHLWPGTTATNDLEKNLASAYVRSIYLQQDLVRQFIDADDEQARFNVISELVGAGRVTELQMQLEKSKMAWVKSCNAQKQSLIVQEQRLSTLEAQLNKLGSNSANASIQQSWTVWWAMYANSVRQTAPVPTAESNEAATALDTAMRSLQAIFQSNERNRQQALSLMKDAVADRNAPPRISLTETENDLAKWNNEAERLRKELLMLQSQAAEIRRTKVQLQEERAAFRAFAQMALRYLDEKCPVCHQKYDIEETKKRLTDVVRQRELTDSQDESAVEESIQSVASAFAEANKRVAEARSQLQRAQQAENESRASQANKQIVLRQLGIELHDDQDLEDVLRNYIQQNDQNTQSLLQLRQAGEKLALSLAQVTEQARKSQLQREIKVLQGSNAESSRTIQSLENTERLASSILEGLREASTEVVDNQLKRIEPLLQRIYARVDVHPAFKTVSFRTHFSNRRGRLFTSVKDRLDGVATDAPEVVFSSSQMNALAVSIFLSLNLGLPGLPLQSVLLDDPLQSLDDVNLLGLIDLLRRTKDQRQLLVSTHDERFGKLLQRKLRAVDDEQRTTVINFFGWQRSGPVFDQHDVSRDERPMRIAVA
jgi:DNA repair exonuclease SbcCD ATPase subunit